jgi:hypothetical protein
LNDFFGIRCGSIRTWGNPDFGGAYASDHNLALGKPATQSSIYPHRIRAVAGYAVDGKFKSSKLPHDVIKPSSLRAAKALSVE